MTDGKSGHTEFLVKLELREKRIFHEVDKTYFGYRGVI